MSLDDEQIYDKHLKEVFDSCDLRSKGCLNRNELIDLTRRLHLTDHIPLLLKELLGDVYAEGEVSFETFRDGFINVLSQAIDACGNNPDEVTECGVMDNSSVSSIQKELNFDQSMDNSVFDVTGYSSANHVMNTGLVDELTPLRKTSTPFHKRTKSKCRNTNASAASNENCWDAAALRKIWQDVDVADCGYINLIQLSSVCENIGMDKLNEDELELLFTELDVNQDGLVSFEEFFNGLMMSWNVDKRSFMGDCTPSLTDSITDIKMSSSQTSLIDKQQDSGAPKPLKSKSKKLLKLKRKRSSPESFMSLDLHNSGSANISDVRRYLKKLNVMELCEDLSPDDQGNVRMSQIVGACEGHVNDKLDKSLLQYYKMEVVKVRGQLDASSADLGILKGTLTRLENDNDLKLREGEQQLRLTEQQNEEKLKLQAQLFSEKVSAKERELSHERAYAISKHQRETQYLSEKLEDLRSEDAELKDKLRDANTEISRLEESLNGLIDDLTTERSKYARLEKELEATLVLKDKMFAMEQELSLSNDKKEEQTKRVYELEKMNKEMRDQIDEYAVKVERLSTTRAKLDSRSDSYMSSYVKPSMVRRNEFGESCEEDKFFSTSLYTMQETDELQCKIMEQESVITSLRRELETVNRLLHENASMTTERHSHEVDTVTEKFANQLTSMEQTMNSERDSFVQEKQELRKKYEMKIETLRKQLAAEKSHFGSSLELDACEEYSEIDYMREKRKLLASFREEKDELELTYRTHVAKIEEKLVQCETEKAELELKFVNEKAELEQKFRIERAELQLNVSSTSREYERSQKYIDFLKDDFNKKKSLEMSEVERKSKKEKLEIEENLYLEMQNLKKNQQREINELKKSFDFQLAEANKVFNKERASMKELFAREKSEIEQKFFRDKNELRDVLKQEYDHNLALQLADVRKTSVEERTEIEEQLAKDKYELSKALQQEKTDGERALRQLKATFEAEIAEQKSYMKEELTREISIVENHHKREISELQQAFTGGEAGMKGRMKEDFNDMISKYKEQWESSHQREKMLLMESFAREKGDLEMNWRSEKSNMLECFEREKIEMEEAHSHEKQEVVKKYQRQRENMEEDFRVQFEKLREKQDGEVKCLVERKTEMNDNAIEHMKKEMASLREQKKELETKIQIYELKSLSQKQEAAEISVFQNERKSINQKLACLQDEVHALKEERSKLQSELRDVVKEKATILDNSVQEITEQQEQISRLQSEKESMLERIDELQLVEGDAENLKAKLHRANREIVEKERRVEELKRVDSDNQRLKCNVKAIDNKVHELESLLQDKNVKISRFEEEISHYESKIEHMESVHSKEMAAQKERLDMQGTASATEKSRYTRELNELKEQLHLASASSDRDNALKDKVFHDAKAEVISLNKKLEDKSRRNRNLEDTMKSLEEKTENISKEKSDLEIKLKHLTALLNERKDESNGAGKTLRSDNLVNELYIENADLMKQLANAESNRFKAEKSARQLSEQKRALQRVISKLCNGVNTP